MSKSTRRRWQRYFPSAFSPVTPRTPMTYTTHPLTHVHDAPENKGEWSVVIFDNTICLLLCCPLCGKLTTVRTTNHSICFHTDKTISIDPSLRCPDTTCSWHTFVTRSTWSEMPLITIVTKEKTPQDLLLPRRKSSFTESYW